MGRELVERDTKKNGRRGCRVFGQVFNSCVGCK